MELPARAKVVAFNAMDGVGTVELSSGEKLRFGASACVGFVPEVGQECFVVATRPDPLKKDQLRAAVLNLTGKTEGDKLAQAEEANRRKAEFKNAEEALLARHGLTDRTLTHRKLLELPPPTRAELASAVIDLKRKGHLFDTLFTILVETDPKVFHPWLDELSAAREPESLAFTQAPMAKLKRFVDALENSTEVPRPIRRPVGTIAKAIDANRDSRAAENKTAEAILALARSWQPDAWAVLKRWYGRANEEARGEAHGLLSWCGFGFTADGGVAPLFSPQAWAVQPSGDLDAHGSMWKVLDDRCAHCHGSLLEVLRVKVGGTVQQMLGRDELRVVTCRRCVPAAISPYFVRLLDGGRAEHVLTEASHFDPYPEPGAETPKAVKRVEASTYMSWYSTRGEEIDRVGGLPAWVQGPEYIGCPKCGAVMSFVAQFGDPEHDLWSGDTGMLYAYFCRDDGIVGTLSQCT